MALYYEELEGLEQAVNYAGPGADLAVVKAKVEQQTKNKEELLKAEAQAQLQLVVIQDLVEQFLPVTYKQLVEKVHASVGKDRATEAKVH